MKLVLSEMAATRLCAAILLLCYPGASISALATPLDSIPGIGDIDATWMDFLDVPPDEAVDLAMELSSRADEVVQSLFNDTLSQNLSLTGEVDVVCSGGGFYDAYYMGVTMVLERAALLQINGGQAFEIIRHAGASAGGMMPFEIALKTEATTLMSHLSYGVLSAMYPEWFKSDLMAASLSDHHWRLMAAWQTQKWSAALSDLDDKIILATSCLEPRLTLVKINNYTAKDDQATHAFMSTGTFLEEFDGMVCTDGGVTSGPKMTPLFQEGLRPQLIVDLMETGYPTSMVMHVNTSQYADLIRTGQNEAASFLTSGVCRADAITLCPASAQVDGNICKV